MACNNSGVWNEAGDTLDFSIAPAYWQTNWFRVSYVAALVILLWMVYKLRIRSIQLHSNQLALINSRLETQIAENADLYSDLQRSEAYLAEAQRLTHTGSGVWSVPGWDALYLSEEWYRIYGFDPKQGLSAWKDRLQRMHPEDQAKVQEAKDRATSEKSDYEVDHRIVLPDGTIKYTHTVGHPVLNAYGDVEQFVCTMMDITEHKQAEDALRKTFQKLLFHGATLLGSGVWTACRIAE